VQGQNLIIRIEPMRLRYTTTHKVIGPAGPEKSTPKALNESSVAVVSEFCENFSNTQIIANDAIALSGRPKTNLLSEF
jgi:hypothetical protein